MKIYRFPCALAVLGAAGRPVEEHQVDIAELGLGQTFVHLCFRLIVADVEDLGREEDLISRNRRCPDGISTAGFVLVHCRRVNLDPVSILDVLQMSWWDTYMPVAGFECFKTASLCLFWRTIAAVLIGGPRD